MKNFEHGPVHPEIKHAFSGDVTGVQPPIDAVHPTPHSELWTVEYREPTSITALRERVTTHHSELAQVLVGKDWVYPLVDRMQVMPYDQESALRNGVVTTRLINRWNVLYPDEAVSPEDKARITAGTVVTDVARVDDDQEKMREVYASGYFRDDPDAWQWPYIRAHTENGNKLVVAATGDPDSLEAKIVLYHHILKKVGPYSAKGAAPFAEQDDLTKFGVEVAAGVDVIDAVTFNSAGEGRHYVKPEKFKGLSWFEVVTGEINIDPRIARIAIAETLKIKGVPPDREIK